MKRRDFTLRYGDKVYAMLCINGRKVAEFVMDTLADMTQLIGELRQSACRYGGLAQLYVRNMTRGWSMRRPLMLYNDIYDRVATRIPRDKAAVMAVRY